MKVLRIKLRQNQAVYNREEMVTNKMTYPLPFYSTIIGALHNACGYTSYHHMDVSVQGKYGSMQREVYSNNILLNSCLDDRNILVWLRNPDLFNGGYIRVAEGINGQGNSFKNRITIRVYNEEKLQEYIDLKNEKENLEDIKKNSGQSEDKVKKEILDKQLKHFKTLVRGPQTQEVLYDVELVIHIRAEEETIQDIIDNQNNFVSLGRSEDYIDLLEMKIVDLLDQVSDDKVMKKGYRMYLNKDKVDSESYIINDDNKQRYAKGTVYYVSKDYHVAKNKRIFNKIPCLYGSNFGIDSESKDVFYDEDGDYIVDLN